MLRVKRRTRNVPYIGPAAGTRGAASKTTTAHASARPTTVTTPMATDLPTQPSLPVIPLSTPPVVDPHQQVMANFPINENRGEQISGIGRSLETYRYIIDVVALYRCVFWWNRWFLH
ncbi:uncharacterized protein LOC130047063 [Ostrea edulis]|uniref:uncharacterized protein LOC130047063 n=1 Tax=Ostrea edulis TaxID=37623 RepID=UPI0024AF407B|nr:uncharacterized protein LOC130047063 [Ostrea edulis]